MDGRELPDKATEGPSAGTTAPMEEITPVPSPAHAVLAPHREDVIRVPEAAVTKVKRLFDRWLDL